jgi:long-chain acyl-CoA synthetase
LARSSPGSSTTRSNPAGTASSSGAALVSQVRDLLDKLGRDPLPTADAGDLLHATREAVRALGAARGDRREAAPGQAVELRSLLHRILEKAAERPLRLTMAGTPFAEEWTDLLLRAVDVSDFTVGPLFLGRARQCGDRTLFLLPPHRREGRISWADAQRQVLRIGASLLALRDAGEAGPDAPVALLGANSPEVALFDLACLVTGTRNVPVPANSPPGQVQFILKHAGVRCLFLGDDAAARAAIDGIGAGGPPRIHWLDPTREPRVRIDSFESFLALGAGTPEGAVRDAAHAVHSGDVATVMYTSGTTGDPKGVPFTHANLVTKRYARAAAWPDIGEGDVFLCYLPLYHTFGRWLEMLGCVFWGSVYAFVDDVSVESLLYSFQRVRPTTFISVPKKWSQLAEAVAPMSDNTDADPDRDREISRELVSVTGGRLKRGLSAAGYLPPTVFGRFHRAGIELHSGFGMTEATGGITMTPPGDYRDDSIGVALPGIELRVAEDGELLIRGPYVTPPADDDPPREDDWFATGDIVTLDAAGHLSIIDRKKEIFKNVQGETISPRRVESLFSEFDVVDRVLLIGDGRAYCTVLIVPDEEIRTTYAEGDDITIEAPEAREIFAPLVSTVNRFLAPFERILDFALLSRDLDADRGELTAKGTPRRKLVGERFKSAIEPMYTRETLVLAVGELPVRIPHWVLRQTGIHARELRGDADGIEVVTTGRRLVVERLEGTRVRVGDLEYDIGGDTLRLGEILGRAQLWLGNDAVRAFAGPGVEHWWRRGQRFEVATRLVRRPLRDESGQREGATWASDTGPDIGMLHAFAGRLRHPDAEVRRQVVETLRVTITGARPEIDHLVRELLRSGLADTAIRGECFRALVPHLAPAELDALLAVHLEDASFPSPRERELIALSPLRDDQLDAVLERVQRLADEVARGGDPSRLDRFLALLVRQAISHRSTHLRSRSLLARLAEDAAGNQLRARFHATLDALVSGFRGTLPTVETAPGVRWEEAVTLADGVREADRTRILAAISTTPLLVEARTLLDPAPFAGPAPLERGSVTVRFLGTGTGRRVHHLEWAPPSGDPTASSFECIVKTNEDLTWDEVQAELRLLVRARSGASGRPVVKTQGGGYHEHGLWTEEFIPGQTLDHLLEDLAAAPPDTLDDAGAVAADEESGGQITLMWPFVVSSCTSLVVDFWKRTGGRVALAKPSAEKVVLPAHDWQIGGRLVSIADRVPCERLIDVLRSTQEGILRPVARRHPEANLGPEWPLLFSAALEVLGEREGLELLESEAAGRPGRLAAAALRFASSVRRRGFLPGRIRHAARRYRRWAGLNPDATLEAQAATLSQIEGAYGIAELDTERPGSRMQLFRHTVFRGSDPDFLRAFDHLIAKSLTGPETPEEWRAQVAALREAFPLRGREEFFLARMLYPHVEAGTRAVLVREHGTAAAGVEVQHTGPDGHVFTIRRPANPGETSALYRVFRSSNFRRVGSGDHDLLVVTEAQGRVIGGLIYRWISPTYIALEWIVVSRAHRGRNIGSVLLTEFIERIRVQGVRVLSTGFFRPSFFAKFDFGVDPRYAGLVRFLEPEDVSAPSAPLAPE